MDSFLLGQWGCLDWNCHHSGKQPGHIHQEIVQHSYLPNQEFNIHLSSPGVKKGLLLYGLQAKNGFYILKRLEGE